MMFKKLLLLLTLFWIAPVVCMEIEDTVTIQAQDGTEFQVPVDLAQLSGTIKDLIEYAGTDNAIPLPNINSATWQLIQYQLECVYNIKNNIGNVNQLNLQVFAACKNLGGQELIDLIKAVNYLDVGLLLKCAIYIAKEQGIKNISPKQLAQLPKEIRNSIVFGAMTSILKSSADTYFSQCDRRGRMLGKQIEQWDVNYQGKPICLTHDNKKIVLGGLNKKHFCVLDLKTKKIVTSKRKLIAPREVCVTPDNKKVISRSYDSIIRVWDIDTGGLLKSWNVSSESYSLCATNKNVFILENQRINIWCINTGRLLKTLQAPSVRKIWATPDNKIVIAFNNLDVAICDHLKKETIKFLAVYKGHAGLASLFCVTSDNKKIVSASADKIIHIWDIETGERLAICNGHTDWVKLFCITPDNKKIISSSWDKTIRVWDIETGQQLIVCRDENARKLSFLSALQNNTFIAGYDDGTVQEWDISIRTMWLSEKQVKNIWSYLAILAKHIRTKLDPPCPGVSKLVDRKVCWQHIQNILDGNIKEQVQENDSVQSQYKRAKTDKGGVSG